MANFRIRARGVREVAARAIVLIYIGLILIPAVVFSPLLIAARRFDEDAADKLVYKILDAMCES